MLMRRWHRWIATLAALILAFIAVTGLILQVEALWSIKPIGMAGPPPARPVTPLPDNAEAAAMIARVADAARREPHFSPSSISLTFGNGAVVGTASEGMGPAARRIEIDARTGKRLPRRPDPMALHFLLLDIHAGYAFGLAGRLLSVLGGLSLLVLAVTGLQIWYDAYRRRKDRRPFWK